MSLSHKVINELERRGPDSVRDLLIAAVGPGQNADVLLQIGEKNPTRAEVEGWLRQKDSEAAERAERLAASRHASQMKWTIWTFLVALASLFVAIIIGLHTWNPSAPPSSRAERHPVDP